MQSPNKKKPKAAERMHLLRVKALRCSVCNDAGPCEVHEIRQGMWWLSVALCASCHRDPFNGWHGQRRLWSVMKMDELDALAVTLERLFTHGVTQ